VEDILSEWKETIPLSEDQKLIKELRALIKEKDKQIKILTEQLEQFYLYRRGNDGICVIIEKSGL